MDVKVQLSVWTLWSCFFTVFSAEVTVTNSDLKPCRENKRVCATEPKDCRRLAAAATLEPLDVSCFYQQSSDRRSVTCSWTRELDRNSEASLIFTRGGNVSFCPGIFNPAAVLNVTVRTRNYLTGEETWSQPHTMSLNKAVKPPPPSVVLLSSSEDSLVVSVNSSSDGSCRLRYKLNDTRMWTLAPDPFSVAARRQLIVTIKPLRTFSLYRASASCRPPDGVWSDWSSNISGTTLDRAPSKPPDVCYRVEKRESDGSFRLRLMWKAPDPDDAGGRILGYQVRCGGRVHNVTGTTALLEAEEGNCSVAAFNTAGYSPAAHLSADAQRRGGESLIHTLPSVRNLWVSSSYPDQAALLVQWKPPSSVPPVSHFNLQWSSESDPSVSRWSTVDASASSAVIRDVDSAESYLITVTPVHHQLCGRPQSLPADLQHGALLEVVGLKVAAVNKTTVTVKWAWQRGSGPIRVRRYRAMLRTDCDSQSVSLWPDQSQHAFFNLTPNTQYSLLLLADNVTKSIIPVTTDFDELPAVATATPLLLLAAAVFIVSILSRTVYKSYFFPPISSPRGSTTGQWLMDPNLQKCSERNVLLMEDFQVTDVLGEKSLITVNPKSQPSSEETDEDSCQPVQLSVQLSTLKLDSEYVSEAAQTSDRQQHEAHSWFHQKEDEQVNACDAGRRRFDGFLAETQQTTCKEEFLLDSEAENEPGDGSYLICEADYITNSCFGTNEDKSFSGA
ncbi:interleukin-6 receptor subunit beta-like [Stegastes partitus]|uniref:Interleukin-6 receptor subunit beta-like n=1 Tax=Stegastes partitus TaxID=144197 RepID=A0A3B4ZBL3_9TELE|nr:PREDICTED: interleukin-6 receptor subunit beta-like [Stegastes partitus]